MVFASSHPPREARRPFTMRAHDTRPMMHPIVGFALFGLLLASSPLHAETESWATLNTAGMLAYQKQDFGMAKTMFHRALDALEARLKQDGREESKPLVATTLNNLAATHEALGEYAQAELRYRHALTMIEAIQGPDHPDVAAGLHNLASLFFSQRAFARAEPLWQRGLSISERVFGERHPHLVQPLVTLGIVTQAQHKFARAETYYVRAIRIMEQALGADHPNLLPLYARHTLLLRQDHRAEEAQVIEQRMATIRSRLRASKNRRPGEPEGTHAMPETGPAKVTESPP